MMDEKKVVASRFGAIEYDANNLITFPEGLIGFKDLHDFVVVPQTKPGPLFWIQSVDDAAIAFVLTDPTGFFLDYRVVPDAGERKTLGIDSEDECHNLAIVTVLPDRTVTLNLAAPILFATKTNRGIQVILEGSKYQTRTPLP